MVDYIGKYIVNVDFELFEPIIVDNQFYTHGTILKKGEIINISKAKRNGEINLHLFGFIKSWNFKIKKLEKFGIFEYNT